MRRDDLHTYQFSIQQQPLITFHLSHHRCTNNSLKDQAYLVVFAYGDNTYVNESYMCVPFPNTSSGLKDAYNYYQSQV